MSTWLIPGKCKSKPPSVGVAAIKRQGTERWRERKLAQPAWKTVRSFLKALKIQPPHDPTIRRLGVYEGNGITTWASLPLPVLTAAGVTRAKTWERLGVHEGSTDLDVAYASPGALSSHRKKETAPLGQHGWTLRAIRWVN